MEKSGLIAALAVFVVTYAVLVFDKFSRAVVTIIAASAVIVLGIVTQEEAVAGVDFNTIGLLIGMMVIVNVSQKTGMFQYLAIKSAKAVNGEPWKIMAMLAVVTAVVSALLDNVTTVLLIVPITILITDELKLKPYPFLVAQIFASNIGGTATLVGDPPNIMIGSAADLSFMDFVVNVGLIIPVILIATIAIIVLLYGKTMVANEEQKARVMAFREDEVIRDRKLLGKCLAVIGLVVICFVFQRQIHLEAATIALFGAAVLILISGEDFHKSMEGVEWVSIFFFVGLFIVVTGLVHTGAIKIMADYMLSLTGGDMKVAAMVILWFSAIASAIVDNIPFVATMIPLLKQMAPQMGGDAAIEPLWWALSLGACLGGNGTIIGASANVVVAGISERAGHKIKFFRFMAIAFPMMLISIFISMVYMYLRYF